MTLTLERKIVLGFGTAVGVLLLALASTWWIVGEFTVTHHWAGHSHEVLSRIEQANRLLLGMQSAMRGFVITGEDELLGPYQASAAQLPPVLESLVDLTSDNARQRAALERALPLVASARALMERRIAIRRESGLATAIQSNAALSTEVPITELGRIFREMVAEERRLLEERLARAGHRGQLMIAAIAVATLLAAVLVLVAMRRVRRELAQRKAAEEERDRFFVLSRDLLCVATPDGYFKRVNPAWHATLGLGIEHLLTRRFTDFIHPDDHERTLRETEQLAQGRESIDFENRYRAADGTYRWLRWNARYSPREKLIYASARDVTDWKAADERIKALNADLALRAKQLEAANGELESFSYSVSHDLRAPLRHIDGFAALLTKKLGAAADEDTRRFVATISRSAKRMGTLIDDLLEFSRIGRAPLRREKIDHNQLVAEVIADGHFDRTNPPLQWQIGPLPDLYADRSMLRQVWANLIDNAVKYSSKSPGPRVEIGAEPEVNATGEYVFFARDNGVGFDMTYASQLFGVFQRLHGPTEFEGTGIGLANVRRIVSRHGGRTWAESKVGEGATFYFSLPSTHSHSKS